MINLKIKINTDFSDKLADDEFEIHIIASKMSENLSILINNIQNMSTKQLGLVTAEYNNNIYILETEKIEKFYSENQNIYCLYNRKVYRIKKKLYELEDMLDKQIFIRISKSCIVNVKQIECFDIGKVGNIIVKFKDGSIESVSKRKLSSVINFLKERGNCL